MGHKPQQRGEGFAVVSSSTTCNFRTHNWKGHGAHPQMGRRRSEPERVNSLAANDLKSFKVYFSLLEIGAYSTVR